MTEKASPNKEPIVVKFIEILIGKFKNDEVCFIDPLDPTKIDEILKKITNSRFIA